MEGSAPHASSLGEMCEHPPPPPPMFPAPQRSAAGKVPWFHTFSSARKHDVVFGALFLGAGLNIQVHGARTASDTPP